MDVMLQNHNAKHVCNIPNGLPELCADISREVIRVQPDDLCCFIAEYLDSLMITRENTKVAIKFVQSIMLQSEQILDILSGTGLKLEEIAAVAPRLQKAFRAYLDAIESQRRDCGCVDDEDSEIECESELSVCKILQETGASYHEACDAAVKIQALFRGHRERMLLAEERGEVQWQRAVVNTMEILRKAGVTQLEATRAAIVIQSAYRGYYTRKNLRIKLDRMDDDDDYEESVEKVDMDDWFQMMFENSGITPARAHKAATIIQRAFREHLERIHPKLRLPSSSRNSALKSRDSSSIRSSRGSLTVRSEPIVHTINSSDDDSQVKSVKFDQSIVSNSTQSLNDEKSDVSEEQVNIKTEPTEEVKTEVKTEPDDTQVKSEPADAQVKTEPDEAQVKSEPDEAQVKSEPDEAQVKSEPAEAQVKSEPDDAAVEAEPADVVVKSEPPDDN